MLFRSVLFSGHRLGGHHSCLTTVLSVTHHKTIWFLLSLSVNGAGNLLCHRVERGEWGRGEWGRGERGRGERERGEESGGLDLD